MAAKKIKKSMQMRGGMEMRGGMQARGSIGPGFPKPTTVKGKVAEAKKAFEDSKSLKGREQAIKASGVGKPGGWKQAGQKWSDYKKEWQPVYVDVFTREQERKIQDALKVIRDTAGRNYYSAATRAVELEAAKKKKKKK